MREYFWFFSRSESDQQCLTISNNDYIQKWSNEMLTAVRQNSDSIDNYYYYITDWNQKKNGQTPHTFLSFAPFYNCIEDNILFKD
jgi:hypothetical protein